MKKLSVKMQLTIFSILGISGIYTIVNYPNIYLVVSLLSLLLIFITYSLAGSLKGIYDSKSSDFQRLSQDIQEKQTKQSDQLDRIAAGLDNLANVLSSCTNNMIENNKELIGKIINDNKDYAVRLCESINLSTESNCNKLDELKDGIDYAVSNFIKISTENFDSSAEKVTATIHENMSNLIETQKIIKESLTEIGKSAEDKFESFQQINKENININVQAILNAIDQNKESITEAGVVIVKSLESLKDEASNAFGNIIAKQEEQGASVTSSISHGVSELIGSNEKHFSEVKLYIKDMNDMDAASQLKLEAVVKEQSDSVIGKLDLLQAASHEVISSNTANIVRSIEAEIKSFESLKDEASNALTNIIAKQEEQAASVTNSISHGLSELMGSNEKLFSEVKLVIKDLNDVEATSQVKLEAAIKEQGSSIKDKLDFIQASNHELVSSSTTNIIRSIEEEEYKNTEILCKEIKVFKTQSKEGNTGLNEKIDSMALVFKLELGNSSESLNHTILASANKINDSVDLLSGVLNTEVKTLREESARNNSISNSRFDVLQEITDSKFKGIENILTASKDEIKQDLSVIKNDLGYSIQASKDSLNDRIDASDINLKAQLDGLSQNNANQYYVFKNEVAEQFSSMEDNETERARVNTINTLELTAEFKNSVEKVNSGLAKLQFNIENSLNQNTRDIKNEVVSSSSKAVNTLSAGIAKQISASAKQADTIMGAQFDKLLRYITGNSESLNNGFKHLETALKALHITHEQARAEAAATYTSAEERTIEVDGMINTYKGEKLLKSISENQEILFNYVNGVLKSSKTLTQGKLTFEMFYNEKGYLEKGLEYKEGMPIFMYKYSLDGELIEKLEYKYENEKLLQTIKSTYNKQGNLVSTQKI